MFAPTNHIVKCMVALNTLLCTFVNVTNQAKMHHL